MKKLFLVSLAVFLFCACKKPEQNQAEVKAAQFECDETFTNCVNRCHHTTSSSSESYDCMQKCKEAAKKCNK